MSDTDQPQTPPPNDPQPKSPPRRRRRRWLFAGGLGLAALAGLLTTRAWAHGHHFGRFGHVQSEADLRERLERAADFALSRVDATDLQRQRVNAILQQSAPGLFRAHQNGATLRRSLLQAVADGDSAKAETLRKQGVAWADELSRLALSVVEQSLRVLDEAQRAEVREHLTHMADRHHHRGRH
jgi:Spy/CpxP family protein refolding chaperone